MTRSIASVILRGLALVLVAGGLSSCDTVGTEETVWQDVGSFGWPAQIGATMVYKVDGSRINPGTTEHTVRAGKLEHYGVPMYQLSNGGPVNVQLEFLPTRDTLFTENALPLENGLKTTYALVAPLDKGHTWIASYNDSRDVATVRATIIERYSSWKLQGKMYTNVIAVRYDDLRTEHRTNEWIRFYAKDVGLILTVMNVYPQSTNPDNAPAQELGRVTLVESSRS